MLPEPSPRASSKALVVIRQWQSPTEEIRHTPDSKGVRIAVWALAVVLVGALASTPFVRIDRVVSSQSGKIVSKQSLNTFQALDPSIIKSIEVKEGQQVKAGQVLATLDPTFATADVGQLRQQVAGLDAQIARAQAEIDGTPLSFPSTMPLVEVPYAALQRGLYDQRASQYASQVMSLDEKISTTEATLAKLQGDDARFGEREKISAQVEDMRSTLYKSGASSLLSLLQSTDQRLEVLNMLENTHNSLIETDHQLAALRADRVAFVQQWAATTTQELVSAQNQRDTAIASLEKAAKHQDLVRLTAPDDAVVLSVAKLSTGSVLRQGDELLSLAPLNAPIEAEVQIPARDIGFVRPADPVTLKVDAFNFYEHGKAKGTLNWISEGAFTAGGDGQPVAPYYKARVTLDKLQFVDVPPTFRLVPGMTLTADVGIGSRSIFSYIMSGLLRGSGEAMRGS